MTEKTLRKRAYKVGYQLQRGASRINGMVVHDPCGEIARGYRLVHASSLSFIEKDRISNYSLTLEEVEIILKECYNTLGLKW